MEEEAAARRQCRHPQRPASALTRPRTLSERDCVTAAPDSLEECLLVLHSLDLENERNPRKPTESMVFIFSSKTQAMNIDIPFKVICFLFLKCDFILLLEIKRCLIPLFAVA
jgi:hypothetical protein